jgi:hypothetical protein
MKATILFPATPTTNGVMNKLRAYAQLLASCPFFKGGTNLPEIAGYFGDEDYEELKDVCCPTNWHYVSERGNEVQVRKKGSAWAGSSIEHFGCAAMWELHLDCTRGWLRSHPLGYAIARDLGRMPQLLRSLKSQEPERGVWEHPKPMQGRKIAVKGGWWHVSADPSGRVDSAILRTILRRNDQSVMTLPA